MSRDKTIAVDFDGVIHKYSKGWNGGKIYDPPIEGVVEAIKKLQSEGYTIVVFTCRAFSDEYRHATEDYLEDLGLYLGVTNVKPPAIAYIDDRGIRFTNWPDMVKYFC